jgi:lysyl-tRNA synthetase class 1
VPVLERDVKRGTIVYAREDGSRCEVPVTGGHCKLQWKPDMGMRWAALGVDYEMYGKDHLVSGKLYSAICSILGGTPPEQFVYELFLDEEGQKISKSKGNGLSIEEWLAYAPQESLALYMFQTPQRAKRLYFDVIPKAVDEYLTFLHKFPQEDEEKRVENPVWHIHRGTPPAPESDLSFSLLLNLASACNPEDKSVLWGFISRYAPQTSPELCPMLDRLAGFAVNYYHDFVKPHKTYRAPTDKERAALIELQCVLEGMVEGLSAEDIQTEIYRIGRDHGFDPMKDWFSCMYQVLLGSSQGPRMGSFILLYGRSETSALVARALST